MSENGEVEIELGGKRRTLRCSLRAARAVSGVAGGFGGAFEGLERMSLATSTAIVAAGLGLKTSAEIEAIENDVYEFGLEPLAKPLARFVSMLMNGGREPSDSGAAEIDR